jgi:hypothetical protein
MDSALSWVAISPDVTTNTHPTTCPEPTAAGQPSAVLHTIAVAPSDSNTVYVGSNQGEIEVTSNARTAGTTWSSIVPATATLPTRAVTDIVVDPLSKDIAYATFSGFGTCTTFCSGPTGHVFKTINGTAGAATTWADISGTATKLPDIPVNAIVIDPDDATHNTLYVGTDIGAFFTLDGGLNWSPLGAAATIPNAQILSLTLHNPSRTLRAATHGRGMWDINLGPGPNTPALEISKLSPFSANAPGTATTLTVNGTGFTSNSKVNWNGSPRTTTFGSATQLTASIIAADLSCGTVAQVTVVDGANTSNSLPFTVLGPAPTISSVSPTSAPVNSPNTPIIVTGTNFCSNSIVIMNPDVGGTASLTPTSATSTQLNATVPASFMANFGSTNSVGVLNPPPGGGETFTTATVTLPTFTVVAPAPANDNFANAINITTTSFTDTKDSSGATTQTNDPAPACSQIPGAPVTGIANTIWYKVVPSGSGTANIDTIGSSYDTVLSVWSGTSQTALTAVPNGCNDDINPGIVLQSQIQNLPLNAGTTYYIMASSFGALDPNPVAFGGKSVLNFSFTGTIGSGGSFTLTATAATVTTTAGAAGTISSTTSTITVTPSGGFNAAITLTCPSNTSVTLPPGVTCSGTIPAGSTTGTLTVNLLNPSATLTAMAAPATQNLWAANTPTKQRGGNGWWTLSAGTGFAALFLLFLPGRKRYRAALGLGLVCVLSLALGCNGGYGGGRGGPVVTTTNITVASSKLPSNDPTGFKFTINITASVAANAQVQLFDGSATLGPPVSASSGTATINSAGLAQGTHLISAHYLGDTYTQASQSGTLYVTVTTAVTTPPTPPAVVPVTGTSGSTTSNTTLNLTIN